MSRRASLILFFLLALLPSTKALAIEITGLGGLNFAAPTETANSLERHWTGSAGVSYGLTFALPLFDSPFDLETGVFMINENSDIEGATGTTPSNRKTRILQLPLVVRFNFDEHIGLGIGGYLGMGQGNVESTIASVISSQTYESLGLNKNESGLILNVRARFDLAPPLFFVLDARYQHGLSDRSTLSGDQFNTRSVQGFAGLQYIWL